MGSAKASACGAPGGPDRRRRSPSCLSAEAIQSLRVSRLCSISHWNWIQVAKPSLSHSARQSVGVAASPNHWCDSSCRITSCRYAARLAAPCAIRPPSVTISWVSIAEVDATLTTPALWKGYRPKRLSSQPSICGIWRSGSTISSSVPDRVQIVTGTPCGPVSSIRA